MIEKGEGGWGWGWGEGGVTIFVHKSLCYLKQNDFCINYEAIERLSNEITNNEIKNKIFNINYRLPDGSVIKREANSTSSTTNGPTNGQTSTTKGLTDPTKW